MIFHKYLFNQNNYIDIEQIYYSLSQYPDLLSYLFPSFDYSIMGELLSCFKSFENTPLLQFLFSITICSTKFSKIL